MAVGDVSMGGRRISNLGHTLQPHETANKFYVDNSIESVKTYSSSGAILKKNKKKKTQSGDFLPLKILI